jgi:hypothetical protein
MPWREMTVSLSETTRTGIQIRIGGQGLESCIRNRMKNMAIQPYYEDSATYQESLLRYKESMAAFFKEEGLVKK